MCVLPSYTFHILKDVCDVAIAPLRVRFHCVFLMLQLYIICSGKDFEIIPFVVFFVLFSQIHNRIDAK